MLVMHENWVKKLEGSTGVNVRLGLGLSMAKHSNAMFNGLLVGLEMVAGWISWK